MKSFSPFKLNDQALILELSPFLYKDIMYKLWKIVLFYWYVCTILGKKL